MGGIKNYLVDTDVFIDYFNGKNRAKAFFTDPPGRLYYSKVTRKELLSIIFLEIICIRIFYKIKLLRVL
ncbi:MAG: hypothetical protein ABRQ37_05960 [Candidatus Eremiobacterota bacterium]